MEGRRIIMAKMILDTKTVELKELNVSVEVHEGYSYVAVDPSGFVYAYEREPGYDSCEGYWVSSCCEEYLGLIFFESDLERELCKNKFWKVGE